MKTLIMFYILRIAWSALNCPAPFDHHEMKKNKAMLFIFPLFNINLKNNEPSFQRMSNDQPKFSLVNFNDNLYIKTCIAYVTSIEMNLNHMV